MADRVDIREFNAIVERREGTDKVKQEDYLVGVLKSLVAECAKRDMKMPDENVLKVLGVTNIECVYRIVKTPGNIYSVMAKYLLDDPDYRLDVVRVKVAKRIQDTIKQEVKIQQEVNV